MPDYPATFGKRGVRPPLAPASAPSEPGPSPAYLELAAAARAALNQKGGRDRPENRGEPAAVSRGGDDDMRAFIGPNWGAYRSLWVRMARAPGLRWRRSLFAATFSSVWLLYRKQYLSGIVILVAQAAMLQLGPAWSPWFDILVAAICGQFGMSVVLMRGVGVIARLRASGASAEVVAVRIRSAGGVNWVAALCGAALLIGVIVARASAGFGHAGGEDSFRAVLDALGPR